MPDVIKIVIHTAGQEGDGSFVYIQRGQSIQIGRHIGTGQMDLPIYNQLVSKQHCTIHRVGDQLYIEDLGSKNGTELNGQRLVPYQRYALTAQDQLTLVNGLVGLQVEQGNLLEETREYVLSDLVDHSIQLNDFFQRIEVSGESITLSKKEYQLFRLLYGCLDHFVTREQIIEEVWSERYSENVDLVGIDEVNSLIYRTNKKLNKHFMIKSVYKKGVYMKRSIHQEVNHKGDYI
ncbi:FHA domain-containing protein [Paenibacillus sp. PK4536]|uniref:FHA domain-containing protein n=1 Tax=Paenibacillus nuruki TaxID=1886670 RepID=A0A1E3KYS1_9BACL|nr:MULTISPECIES: FHA domain-containing protein [Paenibacillus]ODP26553.1 hypothetical protein PTI45_04393 [Paenibacillus nuruki]TKJ89214.1 hypothetical protein PaeCFBP13512_16290 [Paenibacillus sp. CFBP13512]WIM40581.1 FHA domain-containing protein [Paenibacillus sp. PK4536]CAJ1317070.1 FHA domain-containing protein [Paenibacillus nuruki]